VIEQRKGVLYSLAAYGAWGFMPVYIRLLGRMPALEIVAHRSFWSCVLLGVVFLAQRRATELRRWFTDRQLLMRFFPSALLMATNWCLYVFAVGTQRVVDASLGYFINPLFSVVLGVVVLKEKLRRGQWVTIALAALGVVWIAVASGQVPWIGLILATSFSAYGLLRKTATLGSFEGLLFETLLLMPLAGGMLLVQALLGQDAFFAGTPGTRLLLVASGLVTAVPLVLFSMGARRVPLSQLGLLQYLSPSIQFALGVFAWGEPAPPGKIQGFILIWLALGLYSLEGIWSARQRKADGLAGGRTR
jgi:chloramphenicol-sensitive protein RarD